MTDVRREMFEYARAQAKARAERKKERAKLKGLDTVSSKRRRTEKMNRELAKKKRRMFGAKVSFGVPVLCGICGGRIREFTDCEIDHINPRGMGGGARDDSDENLRLTHSWCNREKGSKRVSDAGDSPEELRD